MTLLVVCVYVCANECVCVCVKEVSARERFSSTRPYDSTSQVVCMCTEECVFACVCALQRVSAH